MKALIALMFVFAANAHASDVQTVMDTAVYFEEVANNDCSDVVVLTAKAAIHSPSSSYKCDYWKLQEVVRNAEEAVESKAYKNGFSQFSIKHSSVIKTGYLGYQPDFNKSLGYGCIAEAVLHARH